jgi:hypothetical protein
MFEKHLCNVFHSKFSEKKLKNTKKVSPKVKRRSETPQDSFKKKQFKEERVETNMEPIAKGTTLSQELNSLLNLIQESSG